MSYMSYTKALPKSHCLSGNLIQHLDGLKDRPTEEGAILSGGHLGFGYAGSGLSVSFSKIFLVMEEQKT